MLRKADPEADSRESKSPLASVLYEGLAKLRKISNFDRRLHDGKFCCDRKNPQVLPRGSPKTFVSDDTFVFEQQGFYRCPASNFIRPWGSF
jgi:hypothetical protein